MYVLHVLLSTAELQNVQMFGFLDLEYMHAMLQILMAMQVALMLNGAQMGGKRRSAYHYDLWNLKYLPKFKWDHLTEEISKLD